MKYHIPIRRTAENYGVAKIEASSPEEALSKFMADDPDAELEWDSTNDIDWDDETPMLGVPAKEVLKAIFPETEDYLRTDR
jgi:hypothetical protein